MSEMDDLRATITRVHQESAALAGRIDEHRDRVTSLIALLRDLLGDQDQSVQSLITALMRSSGVPVHMSEVTAALARYADTLTP